MKRRRNVAASLERRLNSYALAASTAGVGILALAQPAEAKIVYTPVSVEIGPYQYYLLDLNNDGIADFKLSNYYHVQGSASTSDLLFVSPASSRNEPRGYINAKGYIYASALKRGVEVNGRHWRKDGFNRTWRMAGTVGGYKGSCSGPWTNVKNRYLGLKFQVRGKTHYGWARRKRAVFLVCPAR